MDLLKRISGGGIAALVACVFVPGPVAAQSEVHPAAVEPEEIERGPVTDLPLPRFVSLRAAEANVRRGPSLSHRIDWVYQRRDLPLEITAEYEHWRRVRDRDGQGGWVHYALLSGVRTGLVESDNVAMHSTPRDAGQVTARLMRGVVVRIDECSTDWCRVRADGHRGWLRKPQIWGVEPEEILE